MVALFLLERAWILSPITPEDKLRKLQQQEKQKQREKKKDIDTGQTLTCPICGDRFRFIHIEKEATFRHTLKKTSVSQQKSNKSSRRPLQA